MAGPEQATADGVVEQRDALVGRLFQSALGMIDVLTVYLGDRLGLYQALADTGWMTPPELAARTGSIERYVREWLEQQSVTGLLEVEECAAEPAARRYRVPLGHQEVLLDRESLYYLAPLARIISGSLGAALPAVADAFWAGGGVPWSAFGADGREGQADLNRPVYLQLLAQAWLPAIPDVHARLQADPPARVADIGCGGGWSSIAIAQGYPRVQVDGFDIDEPSIELARANAAQLGLGDRVQFQVRDVADPGLAGRYDLVTAFEMVHDVARPVELLRTMRGLAADGGTVLVMDERVAERFTAPGDEVERFMYGASVLCCLPAGLAETPSAGTGTVMRPAILRGYAIEAGFRDIEILPIEHDFYRVYRLIW